METQKCDVKKRRRKVSASTSSRRLLELESLPPPIMDSHSVSPFFRLPAELRLKIYKDAWTVPEAEYVYRSNRYDDTSELRLSVDYLTAQLSAIRKLGAISQRIRAEAYLEYFDHTQIVLRNNSTMCTDHNGLPWDQRNRRALYIIAGSYLLQTQARHVKLHWPARIEHELELFSDAYSVLARNQEEIINEQWAVDCISRFKNLRSLEVHVDDRTAHKVMTDNYWRYYIFQLDHPNPDQPAYDYEKELKRMFYDDERRAKLMEGLLKTHHRKLEKAIVRTNIRNPEIVKLMNEHKAFKWWRQLKRDVAVLTSQGSSSVEGKREATYVFKQQIGSRKPSERT